ncbi:hypothetical protein HNR65_002405 [Desulfosalsimonas propionicica]|uniref:DUF2971 domain-containing protein n=1 Tax=Desulfosalsimonas propionicica TaxID=332175 RepID=A0A7W0CAB1_9BACT|nr:DUF2971 domain-containing protein [Desulfosalsimonas propionicica]MBA2882071.1 hypothetical protein [Desulfosalsimonas propionicica]
MWKDDFMGIMEAPTITRSGIERAMELKEAHLPSRIYRFRKVDEYSLKNLDEDTVWLSSAAYYNDPFECCTKVDFEALSRAMRPTSIDEVLKKTHVEENLSVEEIEEAKASNDPLRTFAYALLEKHDGQKLKKHDDAVELLMEAFREINVEQFQKINRDAQTGTKVCSFSERKDSPVMWAHYANKHTGFCIEYDVNRWPPRGKLRRVLYPVIYENELFDATQHIIQSIQGQDFNNLFGVMAATHKANDWSYEREWRFVLPIGDETKGQVYHVGCPGAVYLGAKMSEEDVKRIKDIASKKGFPVIQMQISRDQYSIERTGRGERTSS